MVAALVGLRLLLLPVSIRLPEEEADAAAGADAAALSAAAAAEKASTGSLFDPASSQQVDDQTLRDLAEMLRKAEGQASPSMRGALESASVELEEDLHERVKEKTPASSSAVGSASDGDAGAVAPTPAPAPVPHGEALSPLLRKASMSHVQRRRELSEKLKKGEGTDSDVAAYAKEYRKELQKRQSVFLMHVSKAGGTFLCVCGLRNGCRAPGDPGDSPEKQLRTNCHGDLREYHQQWGRNEVRMSRGVVNTCGGLARMHRQQGWTLAGDENFLVDGGPCHQFWNVIVMRDPIERLISHVSMLHEGFPGLKPNRRLDPRTVKPRYIFAAMPLLADNYYIRSLLGMATYTLPFGQIREVHLKRAKRVLAKFDVLFDLEKLHLQIIRALGWACQGSQGRSSKSRYGADLNRTWNARDWKLLKDQNHLDRQLFEYARSLIESDWRVLNHPVFVESVGSSFIERVDQDVYHRGSDDHDCGFLQKQ